MYFAFDLASHPITSIFSMSFSRVFAAAAFALSGVALTQLSTVAQTVPVDFSGEVAPECEPINVTPGVLASLGGFASSLSSNDASIGGQNAVIGRFSCNQDVQVQYDGISAPATNPIALENLDCAITVAGGGLTGSQTSTRCDIAGGGILLGGGNGEIVSVAGAEVALEVFSPAPMPVGVYEFTVNLSVVPN